MQTPKRPIDEFAVALIVLLGLPLLPLLLEFLLTWVFKSSSVMLLEKASVMLTAPLFAVSVGMASRFKGVFGFSLIVAACLAVMYGAQTTQNKSSIEQEKVAPQQEVKPTAGQGPTTPNEPNQQGHPPPPPFLSRIGMSDLPEAIAWYGMICMGLVLVVERGIRHLRLDEPYEFEWNK
jgi:hypothetical protein